MKKIILFMCLVVNVLHAASKALSDRLDDDKRMTCIRIILETTLQFKEVAVNYGPEANEVQQARNALPEIEDEDRVFQYLLDPNSLKKQNRPEFHSFLGKYEFCGAGGESCVYKLVGSKFAAEPLALIAYRCVPCCAARVLAVTCMLSRLGDSGITDYFFRVYGIIRSKYPAPSPLNLNREIECTHIVVNYVDSDLEKFFGKGLKLTDTVIFELTVGEWAGRFFCGICINDVKPRNFGITEIAYSRCYKIGGHTYVLPPGLTPIREDYGCFGFSPAIKIQKSSSFPFSPDKAQTAQGKAFIEACDEKNTCIFSLFEQFFPQYQLPKGDPIPAGAKIYTISAEDVAREAGKFTDHKLSATG